MKRSIFAPVAVWALCAPVHCFAGDSLNLKIIAAANGPDAAALAPSLDMRLDDKDRREFSAWTSRHVGQKVKITIDGRVVSEPRLVEPITSGSIRVEGLKRGEIGALIPKLLDGRSLVAVDIAD